VVDNYGWFDVAASVYWMRAQRGEKPKEIFKEFCEHFEAAEQSHERGEPEKLPGERIVSLMVASYAYIRMNG